MKVRMVGTLVCLFVLVINCNKFVKNPPVNPPQQPPSQSNLPEKPEYLNKLNKELERYPDIVRKLQVIYDQASEYHARNNILAARQVYEEGVDMIFDYEEDDDHIKYPEYLVLKEKILQDFQIILRKEGFEINETSTDILQQEIDILRVIIDAERESELEFKVSAPSDMSISPVPQIVNSRIQRWISRFAYGDQRVHFEKWVERSGKYVPMIKKVLRELGLPEELAYLSMIESGYNPTVVSSARAAGMWQFMAPTGRKYGLKIDGYVDERRDPIKATRAAANHLKDLYFYWDKDWFLALSAYNVSERRLRQAIRRYNTYDYWKLRWPLPQQTRNFVPKFLAAVEIMRNPVKYGFAPPVDKIIQYDEVQIDRQASLDIVAEAAGVDEKLVRDLNTELKISITPPVKNSSYTLRLPIGTKERFLANFALVPDEMLISKITHRIRRGETISEIAEMYKVGQRQLMNVNNIKNVRRLQINQELVIPRPSGGFTANYVARSVAASAERPSVPRNAANRQRITYKVKKNDTLWDIGQAFNISVNNLRAWNLLSRYGYIYPNQNLTVWLPVSSSGPARNQIATTNSGTNSRGKLFHTVRRGDSISRISQTYGVTVNEILQWNDLSRSSIIHPGEKIALYPVGSGASEDTFDGESITYTVRRGDNLWEIARRFGTSVTSIKNINKKRNSRIYPGDKLVIPASQSKGRVPSSK